MRKLIVILIPLLFITCRKDRLTKEKEMLVGSWEWQYTEYMGGLCGNAPDTNYVFTPATVNTNYSLNFLKKGIVEIYKDGNLFEKGRIKFDYWGERNDHTLIHGYGFEIFLDNDSEKPIYGTVNADTINTIQSYFFQNDKSCHGDGIWCCSNICYYTRE